MLQVDILNDDFFIHSRLGEVEDNGAGTPSRAS